MPLYITAELADRVKNYEAGQFNVTGATTPRIIDKLVATKGKIGIVCEDDDQTAFTRDYQEPVIIWQRQY